MKKQIKLSILMTFILTILICTSAFASSTYTSLSEANSDVSQIDFVSNQLTKTGETTATFKYKILNKAAIDITQTIPASQMSTASSVSSSISLDPLTGTGTITFISASDTSKSVIVTLVDQVSGIIVSGSLSIDNTVTEKIDKIIISSPKLIYEHKIYDNDEAYGVTAYEVYDQAGNNITNYSVARNLTFYSSVGTVTGRNGLIKLTGVDFAQLGTLVISVIDPTTGISTNCKLTVVDSWSKAATE